MSDITSIQYIEAFFFKKGERGLKHINDDFKVHTAMGKIDFTNDKDPVIIFTENCLGSKKIKHRGILIPKEAIVFTDSKKQKETILFKGIAKDSAVGVFWKDISYFDENNFPEEVSKMYTEGKIFMLNEDRVVIINSNTIILNNKLEEHSKNHNVSFLVIPKRFIYDLQLYGGK